jgi:hypothetical protein
VDASGRSAGCQRLLASGKQPAVIIYDDTTDDFAKSYIDERKTPPVFLSDVMNYSWLTMVQQAEQSGTSVSSWPASSHVWFGRFGFTAGLAVRDPGLREAKARR